MNAGKPSRRFDSGQYLLDWKRTGKYPAIHDALFALIADRHPPRGGAHYLDLCCSTGLLGQRILEKLGPRGADVVGCDGSPEALAMATSYGIDYPREWLWIRDGDFRPLREFIGAHAVDTLIARRCLPELFGGSPGELRHLPAFINMLRTMGVRRIFLQGRVPVPSPRNVLWSVDREVEALHTGYVARCVVGQCAFLERQD